MNKVKIIDRRGGKNRTREELEEEIPVIPQARHESILTRTDIAKDRPSLQKRIRWIRENLEQAQEDFITVIGDDPDERVGSIIIPSDSQGRPTTGTIVLVGSECPEWYKPGRRVIYTEFSGVSLNLKDWNARAMRWSEAPWRINAGKSVKLGPRGIA